MIIWILYDGNDGDEDDSYFLSAAEETTSRTSMQCAQHTERFIEDNRIEERLENASEWMPRSFNLERIP